MRSAVFVLLAVAFLPLGGAGEPAAEVIVVVSRRAFDPPTVEADRGTIVSFHRRDPGPGTYRIVSVDGSIESWSFEQFTQWSHRFDQPGTYELFIKEHPGARVQVRIR